MFKALVSIFFHSGYLKWGGSVYIKLSCNSIKMLYCIGLYYKIWTHVALWRGSEIGVLNL